jgi:hypothetical protein
MHVASEPPNNKASNFGSLLISSTNSEVSHLTALWEPLHHSKLIYKEAYYGELCSREEIDKETTDQYHHVLRFRLKKTEECQSITIN